MPAPGKDACDGVKKVVEKKHLNIKILCVTKEYEVVSINKRFLP